MNVQQFGNRDGEDFFNAHNQTKITLTPRDRLIMSWENTMELARDFKKYSIIDEKIPNGELFDELAKMQGICASKLHDLLLHYETQSDN